MPSSYSLDTLMEDLKKSTYVPKSQQELESMAKNRYQSAYDQQRLDAQNAAELNQQALDRQLNTIGSVYAKQKDDTAQSFNQAYSQANRQATSRGMQRSSYNNANLAGITTAGNKAQLEIANNETTARAGLEDQKTLLTNQLSKQLSQLNVSQTADTLSYLDQLQSQEYDRKAAADDKYNNISAQLYQLSAQKEQQDTANAQWQKQYEEGIRQYELGFAQQQKQYDEGIRQYELGLAQQQKQLEEEMRQFDRLHPQKKKVVIKYINDNNDDKTDNKTSYSKWAKHPSSYL